MKRSLFILIGMIIIYHTVHAQNINLENIKGLGKATPVRLSGGINANAIISAGNGPAVRDPFTYFFQGNVNVNLFGQINLPFGFNLTNNGRGFSYPTMPNRLSLHPTYKWISAHLGDVSMTFSPYTLNGHQFRGIGVDLKPKGSWKLSAMYGRLNKAVEENYKLNEGSPGYKRMGLGLKLGFERSRYTVGLNIFHAKDLINSISKNLDSLMIYPQENLVLGTEAKFCVMKGLELSTELATTALTRDLRDSTQKIKSNNILQWLSRARNSTSYYTAFNMQIKYTYKKSALGLGYERVAPGYQTLGAYYMNSDIENFTVNASQMILKDRANISMNFGVQKDNLDHAKASSTKRLVTAVSLNYNPNDKLQTTLNYSNFQTYMKMKPQFDYYNQSLPFQDIDTLNYTQLAQNANVNVNWLTLKNEKQSQILNLNLSFQDASDQQGGLVTNGNGSQFYNAVAAYNLVFIKQGTGVSLAYNMSYNTIGRNNFLAMGPVVSMNAKFFNKMLTTGVSTSLSFSNSAGTRQSRVLNTRLNASYVVMKKHNLAFALMNQNRNLVSSGNTHDMTATLGYGYNFK